MKDFKVYQTSGMLNFLVSEASDVRKKEQTLSGDIVSFTADAQSPIKIVVDIDSTGWTGCEVTRTGQNLAKIQQSTEAKKNGATLFTLEYLDNGVKFVPTMVASLYCIWDIGLVITSDMVGKKMSCSYQKTGGSVWFVRSKNDGTWSEYTQMAEVGATIPAGAVGEHIGFQFFNNTGDPHTVSDIQINFGDSALPYSPYSGTTLSVTFPDEVGSVTDGLLTINYDGSVTLETSGQTYTLTSISPIESLIGDNNIWADAGQVSVTYPI